MKTKGLSVFMLMLFISATIVVFAATGKGSNETLLQNVKNHPAGEFVTGTTGNTGITTKSGEITQRVLNINPVAANDNLYAVLICDEDRDYLWHNISLMYVTLIKTYGYKKENIFVHYANGSSSVNQYRNDLDGPADDSYDIDYNAHKSTIARTFNELAGNTNNVAAIPKLTNEDLLFVYMTGRGYNYNDNVYYECSDINGSTWNRLFDHEFAAYCENIESAHLYFFPDFGDAGGFKGEFMDFSSYNVSCKNRVFISATSLEKELQGYPFPENHITGGRYSEFLYYWAAAIRGYYPLNNAPWSEIHPAGNFPFNDYYTNHPQDYDPDSNGDGFVQMEEAFNYANNFDGYSLYGWDRGYSYEVPIMDSDYGINNEVFTMNGLNGIINQYTPLTRDYLVGSKLTINYGSLALTNSSTLTIPENSIIEFSNTNFNLYAGCQLRVDGTISIKANKYVKIYGNGNTILNGNVNAGAGSRFYLYGSGKSNKVLEVKKKIVFDTDLTNIIIKNGKIVMNGTYAELYFNSGIDNITIDNVHLMSTTGSYNGHDGIDIRSNGNITIKNSTLEDGYYGIYTSRSSSAPNINLTNCLIQYCTYGARFTNSGVTIDNCDFKYNTSRGLYCYSMDKTSYLRNSSILYHNGSGDYGVYYHGSSVATFKVEENTINSNYRGVYLNGTFDAVFDCNLIKYNTDYGIRPYNVDLYLASASGYTAGNNQIYSNKYAVNIAGNYASFFLNNGYNELRSDVYCMYGGLDGVAGGTYSANNNYWKTGGGAPIRNTNYVLNGSLTYITLTDNSPENSYTSCSGPGRVSNFSTSVPFEERLYYRMINTSIGTFSINEILDAIVKKNIADLELSELIKQFEILGEILLVDFDNLNKGEEWYIDHAYNIYKSTYSEMRKYKEIERFEDKINESFLNVIDNLIRYEDRKNNKLDLFSSRKASVLIDKAYLNSYQGDYIEAIQIIENLTEFVKEYDECYLKSIICELNVEKLLIESDNKEEIDELIANCESCDNIKKSGTTNINESQNESIINEAETNTEILIIPNPVVNISEIRIIDSKERNVTMYNSIGQIVFTEKVTDNLYRKTINKSEMKAGIYFIVLSGNGKQVITKKIIVTDN